MRPGSIVLCIFDQLPSNAPESFHRTLKFGQTYEVREIYPGLWFEDGEACILLMECSGEWAGHTAPNGWGFVMEQGFHARRFIELEVSEGETDGYEPEINHLMRQYSVPNRDKKVDGEQDENDKLFRI